MQKWNIEHRVTSPTNAQSNGQAEQFLQTIKNSLTKAMEGGEDPHLALLAYITTPLTHNLPSPAELENLGACYQFKLSNMNKPNYRGKTMQRMKLQQAKHYNKNAKDLPKLNIGNTVYIQLKPNVRKWTPGIIVHTD